MILAPSRRFKNEFYVYGTPIYGIHSIPVIIYKEFRICVPGLVKRGVKKTFSEFRPDILHIQSHFFLCRETLKHAKQINLPVVGTNHFMPENLLHYLHLPLFFTKILQKLAWMDFKRIFKYVDIVTTPTITAATLLKNIGLKKEIISISCGIDLTKFRPSIDNLNRLKKKYHIPEGKYILLYVGRLDKEKNIDLIIKGFFRSYATNNLHLVIAGKGAEEVKLKKMVRSLGLYNHVTFTGFVANEDLPSIYAMCDCFIIAGTAELQSIVTMEAMASGLPVIAVNSMALPELVHAGINGYLFEPEDEQGVANCINTMFQDKTLIKQMKKESIRIIKEHAIEKTIDKYEMIYKELVQNNRREKC